MSDRASILILDTNMEEMMQLLAILEDRYSFIEAAEGEACIHQVSEVYPDLILIDDMLTEPNCYDFCHSIKADPATRKIPIILMSDLEASDLEEEISMLGCDDYICKPLNKEELREKVDTLLSFNSIQ